MEGRAKPNTNKFMSVHSCNDTFPNITHPPAPWMTYHELFTCNHVFQYTEMKWMTITQWPTNHKVFWWVGKKKKERKQNKTLVQNIFDFIYTTEGSLLPYFLFVMWSTHYTSDNYVEEILTENFHLSPKFCSSTSRCSLPWITSIVFCLVLSCSKWFPPLLCRLAIFFLVVP